MLKHEKTLASTPRHYSMVFSCEKTECGHLLTTVASPMRFQQAFLRLNQIFPADGVHQIVPLSFLNFTNNYSQTGYFNICDKVNTIFLTSISEFDSFWMCAKKASLNLLPMARCAYLVMKLNSVEERATFNRLKSTA